MKNVKIQSHASLRNEMKLVARGEKKTPKNSGGMSFILSRPYCAS